MVRKAVQAVVGGIAVSAAVSSGTLLTSAEATEARTATVVCHCQIVEVGVASWTQTIPVKLHDPAGQFTARWFEARTNHQLFLQTALAAVQDDRYVNVQLADTVEYSEILNLYVVRA